MQLQISQLAIAQTQDNLRIYNDRYLSGTITLSNLLEIQTLQQNQDAYLDAYHFHKNERIIYNNRAISYQVRPVLVKNSCASLSPILAAF